MLAPLDPAPNTSRSPAQKPTAVPRIPIHFSTPVGTASTIGEVIVPAAAHASAGNPNGAPAQVLGDVHTESEVNVRAHKLFERTPDYPRQARLAGIEADAALEIIVDTDGHVLSAKCLNHLGYGLDGAAVAAALSTRFSPALRDGHPVRVRMRWPVQFRLR
jgi:TonB family protein